MNIDRIYELMYSPLTTPDAILENVYLENYEYIKFYKTSDFLIGEMKCKCYGDDYQSIFYYYFNKNNYLERIVKSDINGDDEVFNRATELIKAKQAYYELGPQLAVS